MVPNHYPIALQIFPWETNSKIFCNPLPPPQNETLERLKRFEFPWKLTFWGLNNVEKKQDQSEAKQNSSMNPILFSRFFNSLWGKGDASVQHCVFFLLFTHLTCIKKSPEKFLKLHVLRALILQPHGAQSLLPCCCSWIPQLFMQDGKGSIWAGDISVKPQCFSGAEWRLQDWPLFVMLERQGFPGTHEQCLSLIKIIFMGATWRPAGHWVELAGPCSLLSGCWDTGSGVPQLAVAPHLPTSGLPSSRIVVLWG